MMAKHTPGPWWATQNGVRSRGGYIAHTNSVMRYEGQEERYSFEVSQRDADKALIAAAPDLLEALLLARQAIEDKCAERGHGCVYSAREIMPQEFKVIDEAIAKARGEA